MVNILDMQDIRNLSLFERITRIRTRFCFPYNNAVIFCVPKALMMKAVGREGGNVKKISQILKKRIKIIAQPKDISDIKKFIEAIVSPFDFQGLEVTETEVILDAGPQSKAALIGRDKKRLLEMQTIVKDFFGKDFRII